MVDNNLKKNKSSRFVFPFYGQPLFKDSPLDKFLINSYFDKNGVFTAVFDNSNDDKMAMIVYNLTCNPHYIDSSFDDDDKEVIIKMQIPEEYKEDVELFKQGKYTKFTHKYKHLLEDFYGKVSSRKERDKEGKPVIRVFDAISPTQEKYKDVALYYGVEVESIMGHGEILDPPSMENELFKSITELYGIKQ